MRRATLGLALLAVFCLGFGPAAAAAEWRSQQPAGAGGFPTLLGEVGDVECWQADRCMLITGGNAGVAAGLFAYDGRGWYRYSTVCGGASGRIAWAGPDDFWTVSDQQKGQETTETARPSISLCHFQGGRVVASYAKPVGRADSYLPMNAAVCAGTANCWFAGEQLPATVNQGAFHLHWDGNRLTAMPSLTTPQPQVLDPGRTVGGLAFHEGDLYESVRVRNTDAEVPGEEAEASLLHRIDPDSANPFVLLFPSAPIEYGAEGEEPQPVNLAALASAHLTGVAGEPLWAVAGAAGSAFAPVTVLRVGANDAVSQLSLVDPGEVLRPRDLVSGAAAEVGETAWVAFHHEGEEFGLAPSAQVARVAADGSVAPAAVLPAPGEEAGGEVIGPKGVAGPIECVAVEQCWMATDRGWLFHLGPDPAPNASPALRPAPVTVRPADESLPSAPPIGAPEDDSGAEEEKPSEQEEIPAELEEIVRAEKPIVSKIKQRLLDGSLLELSFTLRKKAHVRLVARRKGKVVAKTKLYTMAKGRRSVRLRLSPKRWPTKLDLQVHAIKRRQAK
ncbi:MAG TPA: hypothetical protein VMS11_07010 [Solirubrobacterales bacterium]|nr:hypothetical protein [Solirubrobacterales bacterium]